MIKQIELTSISKLFVNAQQPIVNNNQQSNIWFYSWFESIYCLLCFLETVKVTIFPKEENITGRSKVIYYFTYD